jgi:poly(3-hydroxybutyrate) depolymerase
VGPKQGPKQGPSHWPRISIWQGDADHTVAPGNAEQLASQFLALHGIEGAGAEVPAGQGTGGRLWRDPAGVAGPGGITVELRTVAGMGHGYPIAAGTPSDRFVLPVGVDATEALARFWGLSSVR